ncbi:MAG TPA: M20/M25/M40 family metallo-hydrolase [Tepidisphaeraceae bacterium]|nr:M20/M25/M40 family metallo-hydrolase [Tepidisphaeraceae bacterium]
MRLRSISGLLITTALLAICCRGPVAAQQASTSPSASELVSDLTYLASDDLDGRGLGTHGLDLAADFIADRFKSVHLSALSGYADYFQPFSVTIDSTVNPSTTLVSGSTTFTLTQQYLPQGFSTETEFAGPVVFAGYGISSDEHHYDDYSGIDVKGKAVLVLRYEPHNEKGTSRFADNDWSGEAALATKADVAAKHGAVAILLVNPPQFHGPDHLLPVNRGGGSSSVPFIHIKQDVADQLLHQAGSDKTLAQLQTELDSKVAPHSFELKDVTISGKVLFDRHKTLTKNVLAVLPGTTHADEYIVIGAHYDHLGHGGPGSLLPSSHEIHRGADDNASGTTAVLQLAEKFAAAGPRERSIIFVLFSGEEEGLLGSHHFVEHSPVPLDEIVAMVNLDMVGRIRNETLYVGGDGTAEAFDGILKAADETSPLQLKSIGKGGRGPSDHESFSVKKIPVLFFFSGMHPDYHRPTDTSEKVNFSGIAQSIDLTFDIVNALASIPRPRYIAKFDSQPVAISSGTGSRGLRVSLGVVPDYGTDESIKGVKISGTSPGSPAELAGLQDGDLIVQMNDRTIVNLYDLTNFLGAASAGDRVDITIQRNGNTMKLTATLAERKG